jgi:GxxExxY protein
VWCVCPGFEILCGPAGFVGVRAGCGRRGAAGLLVQGTVVVELKAVKALGAVRAAQSINYLKATGLGLCPLFYFDKPQLETRRMAN